MSSSLPDVLATDVCDFESNGAVRWSSLLLCWWLELLLLLGVLVLVVAQQHVTAVHLLWGVMRELLNGCALFCVLRTKRGAVCVGRLTSATQPVRLAWCRDMW